MGRERKATGTGRGSINKKSIIMGGCKMLIVRHWSQTVNMLVLR